MEYSCKLAIARAKREFNKYGRDNYPSISYLWEVMKALYFLREEDEKQIFYKSLIKWIDKNNIWLDKE